MSNWFVRAPSKEEAKFRLFCFPYAGGNATVFSNWRKRLPNFVDVFSIQAPGRGQRFIETPISCLSTKVALLHKEIMDYVDIPYIFVGHSNGALLAFELARELQKSGNYNLAHIVLSAKRPPHLPDLKPRMHDLPRLEFIKKLKEYDFTPDEVLRNDELMELFLPMLRADFSLSETHQFKKNHKLAANASIFWGSEDVDVPFADVKQWQDLIDGDFKMVEFLEGHFFINKLELKYLAEINLVIDDLMLSEC